MELIWARASRADPPRLARHGRARAPRRADRGRHDGDGRRRSPHRDRLRPLLRLRRRPRAARQLLPAGAGGRVPTSISACATSTTPSRSSACSRPCPRSRRRPAAAFRGLTVAPVDRPDDRVMASTLVSYQDDFPGSLAGDYLVVDGRAADARLTRCSSTRRWPSAAGSASAIVRSSTFWAPDELGIFDDEDAAGAARPDHRGGGGRASAAASPTWRPRRPASGQARRALLYRGPGLAAATADAGEFGGVLVQATDDDAAAATAAIERAVAPQIFNVAAALDDRRDRAHAGRDPLRGPGHDAARPRPRAPGDRLRRPDHRPAEPTRVGRGSDAAGRRRHDRAGDGIGRPAQPQHHASRRRRSASPPPSSCPLAARWGSGDERRSTPGSRSTPPCWRSAPWPCSWSGCSPRACPWCAGAPCAWWCPCRPAGGRIDRWPCLPSPPQGST